MQCDGGVRDRQICLLGLEILVRILCATPPHKAKAKHKLQKYSIRPEAHGAAARHSTEHLFGAALHGGSQIALLVRQRLSLCLHCPDVVLRILHQHPQVVTHSQLVLRLLNRRPKQERLAEPFSMYCTSKHKSCI